MLNIIIQDNSGARKEPVSVDAQRPVHECLADWVSKLGLPPLKPSGKPIDYQAVLHTPAGQRMLQTERTLKEEGVADGDTIRVSYEGEGGAR